MSPAWLTSLVRVRQVQEDQAKANLAQARRDASEFRSRAAKQSEYIDDLCDTVDIEYTVHAFVAASAARQSAAALHSATLFAAHQADLIVVDRADAARAAAVACGSAERLDERFTAEERRVLAQHAQNELDEVASRVRVEATEEQS